MNFTIDRRREGDVHVVEVSGPLDAATADVFTACVNGTASTASHVVIDLTHADFLDSSGLSALLGVQRRVRQHGGRLRAAGVHGVVEEVFEIFSLWDDLGGYGTVQEEIRSAANDAPAAVDHAAAQANDRNPAGRPSPPATEAPVPSAAG